MGTSILCNCLSQFECELLLLISKASWSTVDLQCVRSSGFLFYLKFSTYMLSNFSGPTLWDPMDCSPPGSSVHGIFQARMLEWVAVSFSREASWPRDQTCVSYISCIGIGRQVLYQRVCKVQTRFGRRQTLTVPKKAVKERIFHLKGDWFVNNWCWVLFRKYNTPKS